MIKMLDGERGEKEHAFQHAREENGYCIEQLDNAMTADRKGQLGYSCSR